jgi:predicted alpha/beta-hydrolase family hydrolase
MEPKRLTIRIGKEKVSAVLHLPAKKRSNIGVITAHGAGNDMENPLLVDFSMGLAAAGWPALRFNFPYKEKGLKAPDSQKILEETWAAAFEAFRNDPDAGVNHVIAAGKSMGGRVASQMAAEGKLRAEGLIFLGYPLHPAGDKTKIRDGHLYKIQVPMLFFAGTKDTLCDMDVLRGVLEKLSAPWRLEVIEGGDHSFKVPVSTGIEESEIHGGIVKTTVRWFQDTFSDKSVGCSMPR